MDANAFLDKLRAALGPTGLLTDASDLAPALTDHLNVYAGRALAVARPASTAEVQTVVRLCAAYGVAVIPQGGNTGYCGGATPPSDRPALVLSLARLNRVREVDHVGYTLTVDAGVTLAAAGAAARESQRLFPLSLGSEGTCQIGGNLSTNAGGTAVLRYGMMRELVLGLEVVLPDGRLLNQLSGLRKDNTGYDVKQWFLGAEGTLGIITGACLKLFPQPPAQVTALVGVNGLAEAVRLLGEVRSAFGDAVTAFEYLPNIALELLFKNVAQAKPALNAIHPGQVLLELDAQAADGALEERFGEWLLANPLVREATLAQSGAQRDALWFLRENVPSGQRLEGASIKHDVSLPIARLAQFHAETSAHLAAQYPDLRLVAYGHVGDGNLHFNLSPAAAPTPFATAEERKDFNAAGAARLQSVNEEIRRYVHDVVARHGGSFSAEHGIGQAKVVELERYEDPVALDLMRSMKAMLDPQGIMNPGKVVRG
jgi:FAD/FMN-containing dehydrogenase